MDRTAVPYPGHINNSPVTSVREQYLVILRNYNTCKTKPINLPSSGDKRRARIYLPMFSCHHHRRRRRRWMRKVRDAVSRERFLLLLIFEHCVIRRDNEKQIDKYFRSALSFVSPLGFSLFHSLAHSFPSLPLSLPSSLLAFRG